MHTLVIPLLPVFPAVLHTSPSSVSWLATSTMLTGAVVAPVLGRLGDMYGKRRVLLISLGVMSVGSVLGAVAPSFSTLLVARSLQGAAFGVIPLAIAILRDELPAGRAASAIAMVSSTLGAGSAIGLPLSGGVTHLLGWEGVFWVAGGLSLAATALVAWVVPESPVRSGGRFDAVGAAGLAASLVCLLLPIAQGGSWGWGSAATISLLAAAVVLVGLWGGYELRHPRPLVNLRVSRRPIVLMTNLAAIFVGIGMFANFILVGQRLQAPEATGYGFGQSTLMAGLFMAPAGLGMVIFSPVSARLSAARGAHVTLLVGGLLLVLANLLQALLLPAVSWVVLAVSIMSVGTTLCFAAMPPLIMDAVPSTETAAANSVNALMRTIGTSVASAVSAALLVTFTIQVGGKGFPGPTAYRLSYGAAAMSALLVVVLGVMMTIHLRRRRPRLGCALTVYSAPSGSPDATMGGQ
ncbi:MFS transporter [Dactylosporangium sp. AC04546]|uniref:MFS transporter n=1 Tax=Dactylosporangium sp. AC04546 TaxID=2862460 RepID=UPI002E7B46D6|nr:MFS transporter [Dactylosporangium sp. AC04546]WVK86942.1 MFS transporter [Dactylosporangium sp. AC04546]